MPFIRVSYMEQQYNSLQLKQISHMIMEVLIQHFHVPEEDLFQVFHAHKRDEFMYSRNYLNVERSDGLLFIQITCKSGRTTEQKISFYETLATRLSTTLSVRKEDVFVVLLENEFEDWSFGNGVAQMFQRTAEEV
ncbi:tautomerase family protein [Paenibacillus tuaregi]|uniref:tautomerase family protein n=1 Tax=Paenibacillus tuaregi TaxID=1816681 RepID=UPI000839A833|nr:tautomerase family protein [Paenibacillus tuaregi]